MGCHRQAMRQTCGLLLLGVLLSQGGRDWRVLLDKAVSPNEPVSAATGAGIPSSPAGRPYLSKQIG